MFIGHLRICSFTYLYIIIGTGNLWWIERIGGLTRIQCTYVCTYIRTYALYAVYQVYAVNKVV